VRRDAIQNTSHNPLTEEIRLKKHLDFQILRFHRNILSDGDSVYSREHPFEILGTPEKTCLICTGTPVKNLWKFWQS